MIGGDFMPTTGNEATDKLIGVEFTGNVIHQNWYKTILLDNGKLDAISRSTVKVRL